jgi:hypothetical protein
MKQFINCNISLWIGAIVVFCCCFIIPFNTTIFWVTALFLLFQSVCMIVTRRMKQLTLSQMIYYSLGTDQLLLSTSIFILYSGDELYDKLTSLSILQQFIFYLLIILNFICNSLFVTTINNDYSTDTTSCQAPIIYICRYTFLGETFVTSQTILI